MTTDDQELAGVIVPVITPVDDCDCIDEPAFRQVIRYVISAGVDGLFVGGSAGEGPLLTTRQWRSMVEIAFDENNGAVALLGGVADTSTRKVLEKIEILKGIGYAHFVVTPTFYTALTTAEEHLRLFGACKAGGGDMHMVPYNIPECTGSIIPVEVLCDMAARGWIRRCKESSGDRAYFRRLVSEGESVGLRVFMGDEGGIAEGLLAGACGIVPVCANYEPQTFIRAHRAALERNHEELTLMQERALLLRANLLWVGSSWIAGAKAAMASLGMGSGKPVSPLQPLSAEQRRRIDRFVHGSDH